MDSLSTDSWTKLNVSFTEVNAMIASPTIRLVLRRANISPRNLFSHPRLTSLNMPSSIFPMAARSRNATTRIRANETSFNTCSDAVMYCATHADTMSAKCADAQMPAMMDTIEMTWAMKPFLRPWKTAGMKQIKRMISTMLIIA